MGLYLEIGTGITKVDKTNFIDTISSAEFLATLQIKRLLAGLLWLPCSSRSGQLSTLHEVDLRWNTVIPYWSSEFTQINATLPLCLGVFLSSAWQRRLILSQYLQPQASSTLWTSVDAVWSGEALSSNMVLSEVPLNPLVDHHRSNIQDWKQKATQELPSNQIPAWREAPRGCTVPASQRQHQSKTSILLFKFCIILTHGTVWVSNCSTASHKKIQRDRSYEPNMRPPTSASWYELCAKIRYSKIQQFLVISPIFEQPYRLLWKLGMPKSTG